MQRNQCYTDNPAKIFRGFRNVKLSYIKITVRQNTHQLSVLGPCA
jgi:hypothetical protein